MRTRGTIHHADFLTLLGEPPISRTGSVRSRSRPPRHKQKLFVHQVPISETALRRFIQALNLQIYPTLRAVYSPIPPEATSKMRKNYGELLPKTKRYKTALLSDGRDKTWPIAQSLGIIEMLTSEQLRRFGERITGRTLQPDPGVQIICYDPGDFSGPHNDHHPEDRHLRDGYVDIHIALSEPAVKSQWLVYEGSPGLLNAVAEVGHGCMVSVYQLPFWHYTTPLVPVRKGVGARRWVLMASYVQL